ncbi:O-Antigen ligase [Rhodovulum sulfidophilum]|uniref:O-Antigen ligase n=1 Tax=Rhodovulum sulfidophilum TaxID=35806 RepID=A0A0D6AZX4_RHOSU|nr:O-Antigen ligase [Rhodovulum sulfidophilum]
MAIITAMHLSSPIVPWANAPLAPEIRTVERAAAIRWDRYIVMPPAFVFWLTRARRCEIRGTLRTGAEAGSDLPAGGPGRSGPEPPLEANVPTGS